MPCVLACFGSGVYSIQSSASFLVFIRVARETLSAAVGLLPLLEAGTAARASAASGAKKISTYLTSYGRLILLQCNGRTQQVFVAPA